VDELLRLAADYGVRVSTSRLPGDLLGAYIPATRSIRLDARLTPCERRSVLAHELGHAHFRHPAGAGLSPATQARNERQADRFAARVLIDPAEYARLERIDPDPDAIAEALGVTAELVRVYRESCLTRTEGAGYALPRLGRGQWAFRGAWR